MRGPHYRKAPLMKGELSPKANERFGRNDFENLSVICFANATSFSKEANEAVTYCIASFSKGAGA